MAKPNRRRIQAIIILTFVAAGASGFSHSARSSYPSGNNRSFGEATLQTTDNCSACHQKHTDDAVTLFKNSTHAKTNKTCSSCHGGDAAASDKKSAHMGRFVGQPSSNQVLAMCGACHSTALAAFKTSRHFPERRGATRVDCVQCHGAHSVGSPSHNFSFAYYCAGCHGLEYLPRLPEELQKTLSMLDDLSDSIHALELSGRAVSVDGVRERKELRRAIADIVHPTDLQGGAQKASALQERIRELSKAVSSRQ